MDSLHELLRAAPCRLRTCEDGKRRKIGASVEPAQKSAPCELRGARCDRRIRTACATVCELRAVLCELQSCLSTCLASMLRAAICELRLATGPQLADCGSRIAARGFAARPSSSVDTMRTCLASILRAAICDVHLADGLQLADCGSQNAGWPPGSGSSAGIRPRIASCTSQLAGCDPAARREMVCCVPSLTHKYTPRCSHLLGRALSQVAPRRNGGLVACDGVSWSRVPRPGPIKKIRSMECPLGIDDRRES